MDGFTLEILNKISDPLVYTGNPFVLKQEVSIFFKCLFIYGCAGSSLLHGILSSCGAQASHCSGFSCCWAWALGHTGAVVVAPSFWNTCSAVVACKLSCPTVCGIFSDQGRTHVSCIGRRILYHWATGEAPHWFIYRGKSLPEIQCSFF